MLVRASVAPINALSQQTNYWKHINTLWREAPCIQSPIKLADSVKKEILLKSRQHLRQNWTTKGWKIPQATACVQTYFPFCWNVSKTRLKRAEGQRLDSCFESESRPKRGNSWWAHHHHLYLEEVEEVYAERCRTSVSKEEACLAGVWGDIQHKENV